MIHPIIKQRIMISVDSLRNELVQLVSDMIKFPSVNPNYPGVDNEQYIGYETKVNQFLQSYLQSYGLKTDLWEVEKGRGNLVGTYTGTGGKSLLFSGHVDVVPPGPLEDWTMAGPFSGKIADGKIWGRGASDMKGGIGAYAVALKAVLQAGYRPKGNIYLESVSGEETVDMEIGVGSAIRRGYRADSGISAEPSAPPYPLGIAPASSGSLYMRVTIKGKAVHASQRDELIRAGGRGAEIGVSSIDKAFIIYQGLLKLEQEWGQTKSHPLFTRPGHFTIHPGVITGGPQGAFVISDLSTIEYAIWYPPQDNVEDIKKEIEDQITLFAQTDPWLRENPPKVEWLLWVPPYDVPIDAPICQTVASASMTVLNTARFYGFSAVSDAGFLNMAGIQTITIGPGSLLVSHSPNEYVSIQELVDAAKIYALSMVEWSGV